MTEVKKKEEGSSYSVYGYEEIVKREDLIENNKLIFKPEFIPFYLEEVKKYDFSNTEGLLYGFIRFYLKNNPSGKFYFTNEQLAFMLDTSESTISNSIQKICKCGEFKISYQVKANGGTFRLLENSESDYEKIKSLTLRKLRGNKNKINKNKINNIYICSFENFWKIYPKKVGKKKTEEIYIKKVRTKDIEEKVMEGLSRYIKKWKGEATDIKYIPNPTTWLNQERWEDEVVISNERFNKYVRQNEKEWEQKKIEEREKYQNMMIDDGIGGMTKLGDFAKQFKV